jgi:hypothetical protein
MSITVVRTDSPPPGTINEFHTHDVVRFNCGSPFAVDQNQFYFTGHDAWYNAISKNNNSSKLLGRFCATIENISTVYFPRETTADTGTVVQVTTKVTKDRAVELPLTN